MRREKSSMRGFTLIASLLVLVLLSGVAIGLLYLTNGEGHIGGNDLEDNLAFYGAESGMEKMTTDLAAVYQAKLSPQNSDITAVASPANYPDASMVSGMTYFENISWTTDPKTGKPVEFPSTISSGDNQGLIAEIIPMTLQATATRLSGASANMFRTVEVALIPVFQFGVFSDSDLDYFAGPRFEFQGRVQTNGDLFLAANNGPLVLDSKVAAAGEIIRTPLANGFSGGGYQGNVYIPTMTGACDPASPANGNTDPTTVAACRALAMTEGSWSGPGGGIPPNPPTVGTAYSAGTGNWGSDIANLYNGNLENHAKPLVLPFVQIAAGVAANNSAQQVQIIRKPLNGELATTPLGSSRLYNKAEIRVLLADTEAGLRPTPLPANDPVDAGNDIQLDNLSIVGVSGAAGTSFFATANTAVDSNWVLPRCGASLPGQPCNPYPGGTTKWPLIRGWLRVEYLDKTTGNWVGVTNEWLGLGFARTLLTRTAPGIDKTGHPNAILILQKLRQLNTGGAPPYGWNGAVPNASITGSSTNFFPINLYDTREGEPRDAINGTPFNNSTCRVNGVMNVIELDVGNLQQWLLGKIGASGANVNSADQNGYVLYFSDRRGMEINPNELPAPIVDGEYGFEDVINSKSAVGQPDGKLEAIAPNGFSPEDVDENTQLDIWGAVDVGDGFNVDAHGTLNATYWGPYQQIDCLKGGRQNWVSGARHGLKLIDGSLGNVPTKSDGTGGFTVASENPVYVFGDYNSSAADTFWGNPSQAGDVAHAAASVIADAVTFLSNNWTDENSLANPTGLAQRNPTNTYYRMAIAAGKNMVFPQFTGAPDFGTDGGVHNFLRLMENWGGTVSYRGSLISLYYSQYATGTFKCCALVYSAPNRNFFFDTAFLNPNNLPPGTPMFQDVVNLNYHQDFTPQ